MSSDIKSVDLTLAIPFRFLGKERTVITEKLNSLKMSYLPEVDGVLLKWSDLTILDDKGTILDEQPFSFWKVNFTAQIFKPIPGKLIKGKVNRVLKLYFIATAMGAFTITVTIPENMTKNETIRNLAVDQEVYFKIKGNTAETYTGEIDEECIEMTNSLAKETGEDVYGYAKDFEY